MHHTGSAHQRNTHRSHLKKRGQQTGHSQYLHGDGLRSQMVRRQTTRGRHKTYSAHVDAILPSQEANMICSTLQEAGKSRAASRSARRNLARNSCLCIRATAETGIRTRWQQHSVTASVEAAFSLFECAKCLATFSFLRKMPCTMGSALDDPSLSARGCLLITLKDSRFKVSRVQDQVTAQSQQF